MTDKLTDKLSSEQRVWEDIIEIVWEYSNSDTAFEIADKLIAYLNANTAEEEGIRTMTPLENQWMDFKKILSELVVFQEDYKEQTQDYAPGNRYWADKFMTIVGKAKKILNANTEDEPKHCSEHVPMICAFLNCDCDDCSKGKTQITLRKIEEYVSETLKDADAGCPIAREFKAVFQGCIDWLQQEE